LLAPHTPAATPAATPAVPVTAAPTTTPATTPAATTLDIKESLRAYLLREWVAGGGQERWWVDRVGKNPERFARLEAAFMAVWGDAPLSQQKLALALCLLETGCGFGETRNWKLRAGKWSKGDRFWNTEVFLSRAGACGVTQVVPQVLGKDCAHANASYRSAFALQRRWLQERWRYGGAAVSLDEEQWLLPIKAGDGEETYLPYRYNGGGERAWDYGRRWKQAYDGLVLK
jgi:hypothetical protein